MNGALRRFLSMLLKWLASPASSHWLRAPLWAARKIAKPDRRERLHSLAEEHVMRARPTCCEYFFELSISARRSSFASCNLRLGLPVAQGACGRPCALSSSELHCAARTSHPCSSPFLGNFSRVQPCLCIDFSREALRISNLAAALNTHPAAAQLDCSKRHCCAPMKGSGKLEIPPFG